MADFKQFYLLPATPEEVYNALTNPISLEIWTGEPAQMAAEPGTEFSLWDGSITGQNLEFIPNELVRQEWYFGDREENSVVTLKLHPHKRGTSVELVHTNIPDEEFEEFVKGWNLSYFGALREFFRE